MIKSKGRKDSQIEHQRKLSMSLDLINLTNVLEQANGSERGATQKLAENQLKEWETLPGYHYLLQVSWTRFTQFYMFILTFQVHIQRFVNPFAN